MAARSPGSEPPTAGVPAFRIEDLDYPLPAELVATHPTAIRDACRLLFVPRHKPGSTSEGRFRDLAMRLRPGDVLVRNVTRVLPARLAAVKEATGARCEVLLVEPDTGCHWWALVRPARRLPAGSRVQLANGTPIVIGSREADGRTRVSFPPGCDVVGLAHEVGRPPLPPYIRRDTEPSDTESYQTVYARVEGSVAAPTAGLHFTRELLDEIDRRGIECLDLVLHVGLATFHPIRERDPRQHHMHWERLEIPKRVLTRIDAARKRGGRVVAVGTTVARALESVAFWEAGLAGSDVEIHESPSHLTGRTRLFIYPPYRFQKIDALVTNFHQPRSTLLLLVDAFAGRDTVRSAYRDAIRRHFRFLSYGDAMLFE